jgi:hypothetical protein
MTYTRKLFESGIIASYCDRCGCLAGATKAKPKKDNVKLLILIEGVHVCKGEEQVRKRPASTSTYPVVAKEAL